MTLQEHKEKEAEKHAIKIDAQNKTQGLDISFDEFIDIQNDFKSGFDQADPIGFMVFSKNVVLHGYTYNAYWKNWQGSSIDDTITTEQFYLKFIEYKQKQQA